MTVSTMDVSQVAITNNRGAPVFVILGAGRPHKGDQHAALRTALGETRVLDWLLDATRFMQPSVHFVSGYQSQEIKERYSHFTYWRNDEWQSTRAAYSLLKTPLPDAAEYITTYADILFRESFAMALLTLRSDIVVGVDTHWRSRFLGRLPQDMARAEKVCLADEVVTRLGADIDPQLADAEFIGCVRFGTRAVDAIMSNRESLTQHLRMGNLSDLVEMLRLSGLSVTAVDVRGDWAEMNEPRDLARFVLGTKAQTLSRLRAMMRTARIEDQVTFNVDTWRNQSGSVIGDICSRFAAHQTVVVRSSALCEDGFSNSHAGAFSSVLDVAVDEKHLRDAISEVISSYPSDDPGNQVLVQPMVRDVAASGVAFTRSLTTGAPYYVVNYDDSTGSTESITSGRATNHSTLVIRRDVSPENLQVPRLLAGLLPALREIETLLGYDALDVEFAVSGTGALHILQVRPITVDHSAWGDLDQNLRGLIRDAEERFSRLQSAGPSVLGKRTIFGVMPDWNPAEIIGTRPGQLALSLYRELITDEIWAIQRSEYGYRDVRPQPLLATFAGHPYVDVRASLNSFIPACVDDYFAQRLVEFSLDWLERHPHLHDKLEFDVIPTCFALDFDRWDQRLRDAGGFALDEIASLREALRDITAAAMGRTGRDLETIRQLEARFTRLRDSDLPPLEKACALLDDARCYGTLPFAHLARSAFVAVTLLRSAVSTGILSAAELDDFLSSIRTVSHTLSQDAEDCHRGLLDWETFVDRYGHLRPGTYDISSASYRQDPERYLRPLVDRASDARSDDGAAGDGALWQDSRWRFVDALNANGLVCDADSIDLFLREAIEGREYAKFAFTRNLSLALDELAAWGELAGIPLTQLGQVTMADLRALRGGAAVTADPADWLRQRAETAIAQQPIIAAVELPPLICRQSDFSAFVYPATQPNFIGNGSVVASIIDLGQYPDAGLLAGKVALIPQADPGYDWLFGRDIAGLITMWGGANSHMAIRAAEFGLPAAIGVGETLYGKLATAQEIELDAASRLIRIIR